MIFGCELTILPQNVSDTYEKRNKGLGEQGTHYFEKYAFYVLKFHGIL